jgi:hypothetical protein
MLKIYVEELPRRNRGIAILKITRDGPLPSKTKINWYLCWKTGQNKPCRRRLYLQEILLREIQVQIKRPALAWVEVKRASNNTFISKSNRIAVEPEPLLSKKSLKNIGVSCLKGLLIIINVIRLAKYRET